jgi:hypothetical protein
MLDQDKVVSVIDLFGARVESSIIGEVNSALVLDVDNHWRIGRKSQFDEK